MRNLTPPLLLALVFLIGLSFDDTPQIKQVVQKWNTLHNNGNVEDFKQLYSKNVLFYGRHFSGKKSYERKKKFLNPDFSQEIITPINIRYFASGTIKCSFTKRVTYKQTVKEHPCYLLLENQSGTYLITGESDLQTDKNFGVQLNLGKENILKSKANGNYVLFGLVAIALALVAVWLNIKRKKKTIRISRREPELSGSYVTTTSPAIIELQMLEKVKEVVRDEVNALKIETAEQKGYAFEKYVIEKFKPKYFKTIHWQSDKFHAGHYAVSSLNPDIVLEYKDSYNFRRIAIECKWRASFLNGQIEVAQTRQLNNYRKFQKDNSMPVYIVLGIGGKPSSPDKVYIIPLDDLQENRVAELYLKKYFRYKSGDFFLEPHKMILQ